MKVKVRKISRKNIQKDQPKLWRIARYLGIITGVTYWLTCCILMWQTQALPFIFLVVGVGTGGYLLALACFKAGYEMTEREVEIDVPEENK